MGDTQRGRPAGRMTPLRDRALTYLCAQRLPVPRYRRMARDLGLHNAADARRVVRDLARMGLWRSI